MARFRGALGLTAAAWLLVTVPTVGRQLPDTSNDLPRVRIVELRLRAIIDKGSQQSPTLRALIDRVQRSDLVVHIERVNRFPRNRAGSIKIMLAAGGQRYVRIQLSSSLSSREILLMTAHELQHAVEISSAAHVSDDETLRQRVCLVGELIASGYDTPAARAVMQRVSAELAVSADR